METQRILIVEDQWESSDLIADVLKLTFKEWQVDQVTTGHDALERVSQDNFDVIIVDIALADGLTGLDVVRKIAALELKKVPRVILVTGLGEKAQQGHDAGRKWMEQLTTNERAMVEGFFQKPYPWKEFLRSIAHAAGSVIPENGKFFKEDAA